MERTNPVLVVESNDKDDFETQCAELIWKGYQLSSSHCGFVDSEKYDFCASYQAILVFPTAKA